MGWQFVVLHGHPELSSSSFLPTHSAPPFPTLKRAGATENEQGKNDIINY
jgi:hypothetical protein